MRKSITLLIILLNLATAEAQTSGSTFLFNDFESATLILKDGKQLEIEINYNVVAQKICFINPESQQVNYLSNTQDIDSIYVAERVFAVENNGRKVLEVLSNNPLLYVEYKMNSRTKSAKPAYGSGTETVSLYKENTTREGRNINVREVGKTNNTYYLETEPGNRRMFKTSKQLQKLFPALKEQIREYVKQEKINFSDASEVAKLCKHIISLT